MLIFRAPLQTQTDLMSLIAINETNQWPTNKISDKFSSVVNIVTVSSDEKTALQSANEIVSLLNTEKFNALTVQSNNFSLKSITKDLIPYKIEPGYININDYNLTIQTDKIKQVENKENNVFVVFDSVLIGEAKNTTGLVSSSSIKVYTTLYSKDIINILHIHLNDTSLDITIDSEFLEKEDKIEKHKVFTLDALGKRLTYKLLFKDYRLIKIYYAVSDSFIDEPPFEEIRIAPNNYVKIIKGEYKNYYGQVKDFPLGMLARKDKELGELKRMSSRGFQKEGYCPDRHLEELPGFVSVEVLFQNSSPPTKLKDSVNS